MWVCAVSTRIKGVEDGGETCSVVGPETVVQRRRQEAELEVAEVQMFKFFLGETRMERITETGAVEWEGFFLVDLVNFNNYLRIFILVQVFNSSQHLELKFAVFNFRKILLTSSNIYSYLFLIKRV